MSDISCKHPLKAWQIGFHDKTGKPKYKITSYEVDYLARSLRDNSIHTCFGEPVSVPMYSNITEFIEIPCGHCISCRLRYSKDWANRMMLELNEHDKACFITLTYDDAHLPEPNECIDPETGEIQKSIIHPLVKRDLQLFFKRLRKKYSDCKIRFYACGEYGSQNMRPHYHAIIYGVDFASDRILHSHNELHQPLYISPSLGELWTYGYHMIAPVSWETCAYTARYVTKKLNGEKAEIYERYNFPREWSTCSRKPGIARYYYDMFKDEIYANDEIFINCGAKGGKKVKPPKYFDKLYDIDYPEKSAELKEHKRLIAEANAKYKSSLTSLEYCDMLEKEEEVLLARTKILKRK